MGKELGVLSRDFENWLGKTADDAIELLGLWEVIDGPAFTTTFRGVDNHFGEKVPEKIRLEIRERLDRVPALVDERKFDEAIDFTMETVDFFWDVPYLDDDSEKSLFAFLGMGIKALVLSKIEKLKKEV